MESNTWCPRLTAAMILSGSVVQVDMGWMPACPTASQLPSFAAAQQCAAATRPVAWAAADVTVVFRKKLSRTQLAQAASGTGCRQRRDHCPTLRCLKLIHYSTRLAVRSDSLLPTVPMMESQLTTQTSITARLSPSSFPLASTPSYRSTIDLPTKGTSGDTSPSSGGVCGHDCCPFSRPKSPSAAPSSTACLPARRNR